MTKAKTVLGVVTLALSAFALAHSGFAPANGRHIGRHWQPGSSGLHARLHRPAAARRIQVSHAAAAAVAVSFPIPLLDYCGRVASVRPSPAQTPLRGASSQRGPPIS